MSDVSELDISAQAANPNAGSFGVQDDTDFINAVETDARAQTVSQPPATLPTGRPANLSQMRVVELTSAEHNMRTRPSETAERVAVVRKSTYMRIWDSPINTAEDPKMRPWKYAAVLGVENGALVDIKEGWVMSRSMTFKDMTEAAVIQALTAPMPTLPTLPTLPPLPLDPPFLEMASETLRFLGSHHLAVAAAKDSVVAALMAQAEALLALASAEKISANEHRRLAKEYQTAVDFKPAETVIASTAQAVSNGTEEVQSVSHS